MTAQCPSCGAAQTDALLCGRCTDAYATMHAAVPELVAQLDLAASKQTKIATGGKAGKGSAHERSPVDWGAVAARDALLWEAAMWGDDLEEIRRYPQAAEIVRDLGRAVKAAYRCIDRAAARQYLGVCLYAEDGLTCHAELWARDGARSLECTQCAYVHDVAERRAWLLLQAADMLVTSRDASRYVGAVGHVTVTEASIRGYLHRGRIAYRPGTTLLRLGDLLSVVLADAEQASA